MPDTLTHYDSNSKNNIRDLSIGTYLQSLKTPSSLHTVTCGKGGADPRDLRCRVTVRKLPLAQQGQENGEREALGVEESCNTASIALTGA